MASKENGEKKLPKEWVELVIEAMKSIVTKEDFKKFLKEEKEKKEKGSRD